jgi:signal transduction histidine kinase/uncharacterized protein HemY
MPLRLSIFFTFLFSTIAFFSSGQQQQAQSIEWYEQFFRNESPTAVDKELEFLSNKIQAANDAHDLALVSFLKKSLALTHITRTEDYEKALNLLVEVITIEDSLHLTKEQVFTYMALGSLFEEVGDLNKSAEFLNRAISLNEQFKDNNILVSILNKLGRINASLGLMDEAFENYDHVLKYQAEIGDPIIEAEALFNLAHLYSMKGEFAKALDYHKQALIIRRANGDKKSEAQSLTDIGELYGEQKNYEKALANHVIALEIRRALKDQRGQAESFNYIGALYFQQKNFPRAIANLQLSLAAAQESQAQNQIRKSYEYLSACYKELGDFEMALEYKELFVAMSEFIQNERNEQKLLDTQTRYEIDKSETRIEKLEIIRTQREKEIQEQKKFRNVLFALIGLVFIIFVLIFYLYLSKRRSNRILEEAHQKVQQQNIELQELNATKDKFFSIISHDLKGPLNSLTSFSGLLINHADSLSKEEIQMLAKDLDKSLKNLFSLLENLLEWSRSQTGSIEFKPEVFDVNALLKLNRELLNTQALNKKISIFQETESESLVEAHKHSINTVIRNLVSNAIKFTPPGGKISLAISGKEGKVMISIRDTGVGMPPPVIEKLFRIDTKHSTKGTADEKGTGLGLILCKEFVEKNGGEIWVESTVGKGSTFSFTLPATKIAEQVETLN